MEGSATFTTVVSSTIIRTPAHSTSKASPRWRSFTPWVIVKAPQA